MWLVAVRLADAEWLFDMFYVERQHRRVRPQAELVRKTTSWEPSVVFRVLHAQLCTLSGPSPIKDSYTLLGRQRRVTGCVDGWMADKLVCGRLHLHTDDVVFRRGVFGIIVACLHDERSGSLFVQVELLRSSGGSAWTHTSSREQWLVTETRLPVAWRQLDDGRLVIIC